MNISVPTTDFKEAWKTNSEIFVLYRYKPSLEWAVAAFICFFVSTTLHTVQAWRYQACYFVPLILGGIFEWLGYIGRIFAHYNQYDLGIYVWQTLLLLLGPTLMVATMYMSLSNIIIATHGEEYSPTRVTWLTNIFICGDILSFLIQGGGMPPIVACLSQYISMVNNNGPPAQASIIDTGRNMVVAGLILQVVFFSLFILTAATFHYRMSRASRITSVSSISSTHACNQRPKTSTSSDSTSSFAHSLNIRGTPNSPYQRHLITLYFTGVLILMRSLFRIFEFMQGQAGKLMAVEWHLYAFDTLLMLILMICINIWHPGQIVGQGIIRRGEVLRLDDHAEEMGDIRTK